MSCVVAAGMTNQVIPCCDVVVSDQSILTVVGSSSGVSCVGLAVNWNVLPVISTGAVTGGVTLLSVIVSVSLVERVAPRCTVSAAVRVQVQVDAGTVDDANGAGARGQAGIGGGAVMVLMALNFRLNGSIYREMPDEQFTDEEKAHLNYLGSMLHVDPSHEEEEAQKHFDAFDKAREQGILPPTHTPSEP
jgi:hypothetical protein